MGSMVLNGFCSKEQRVKIKLTKILILIINLVLVASCSWFKKDDEPYNPYEGMSEKELYAEAGEYLKKEQYTSAIKRYEAMETMYPFSEQGETVERNLIYAYYKNAEYPSAAATAERYIRLYPSSSKVDYAYYMKGMANFNQPRGSFANIIPLDESLRDSGTQAVAFSDFAALLDRFPNSKYRQDALQHMIYLRNTFADRELNTANFYLHRKMYVAAANRASYVIKNYQQAPAAKKALKILYIANNKLHLQEAKKDAIKTYRASKK